MGVFMLEDQIKIYKGHIIFTKSLRQFTIIEQGYILVKDGKVMDVFKTLPEKYKQIQVE